MQLNIIFCVPHCALQSTSRFVPNTKLMSLFQSLVRCSAALALHFFSALLG